MDWTYRDSQNRCNWLSHGTPPFQCTADFCQMSIHRESFHLHLRKWIRKCCWWSAWSLWAQEINLIKHVFSGTWVFLTSIPMRQVLFIWYVTIHYDVIEQNQEAALPKWPLALWSQLVMARSWQAWAVLPMKMQLVVPSWVGMDWTLGYTWKGSSSVWSWIQLQFYSFASCCKLLVIWTQTHEGIKLRKSKKHKLKNNICPEMKAKLCHIMILVVVPCCSCS